MYSCVFVCTWLVLLRYCHGSYTVQASLYQFSTCDLHVSRKRAFTTSAVIVLEQELERKRKVGVLDDCLQQLTLIAEIRDLSSSSKLFFSFVSRCESGKEEEME